MCYTQERILELHCSVDLLATSYSNDAKTCTKECIESLLPVLLSEADYSTILNLMNFSSPLSFASSILQTSKYAAVSEVYPLVTIF